ncbi:MAG: hypothetical protein WCG66_06430 [bacterium]
MKIKNILAAVTAVIGLAITAQAQTTVYIAGAPALRNELTTAIENLLIGQGSVDRTFNGSAIITANVVRWRNATIGGQGNVTIHLDYNGSAGGWKTNSARQNVRYFSDNTTAGSGKTDVLTNTSAEALLAVPDFHISNEYQASTPWIGTNQVAFPENGATTYQSLVDRVVGILPLRLVASPAAPDGLNITPQLAQQLYTDGELRLSQLTGNQSDYGKKVYPLGRGIDSGVRTLWAAANGVGSTTPILTWNATVGNTTNKAVLGVTVVSPGSGYTSAPTVTIAAPGGNGTTATATATVANGRITGFTVTNGGSGYSSAPSVSLSGGNGTLASARAVIQGGTVTSHALWAATGQTLGTNGTDNRILGIETPEGNGGYATFGPLLTAITSTLSLSGGDPGDIYFTALGDSDADSAIKGGAKEVKWNGNLLGTLGTYGNNGTVTGSSAPNPLSIGTATPSLAYGQYELWGYVRLPYLSSALPNGSAKKAVYDAIAAQLRDFDAPVRLKDVNVQRYNDGGTVVSGRKLQ